MRPSPFSSLPPSVVFSTVDHVEAALADSNQDGFAELVVGYQSTALQSAWLQVGTAMDANDFSQGLKWGAALSIAPLIVPSASSTALAVGRFLNTGALTQNTAPIPQYQIVTTSFANNTLDFFFFTVDPTTLTISRAAFAQQTTELDARGSWSLTAGQSDSNPLDDELAIVSCGSAQNALIVGVDITSAASTVRVRLGVPTPPALSLTELGATCSVWARSRRSAWFGSSQTDQLVIGIAFKEVNLTDPPITGNTYIEVLAFNDNLNIATQDYLVALAGPQSEDGVLIAAGLVLGNFGQVPQAETDTTVPNLEITLL
jgi:hypothetical protein